MITLYTEDQFRSAKTRDILPLKCECCGQTYHLKKKIIKEVLTGRIRRRCCSKSCANRLQKILLDEPCSECGKPVHRTPTERRKVVRVFCSHRCNAIYHNRVRWGERPTKSKRISKVKKVSVARIPKAPIQCRVCGRDTYNETYCSGTCRNKDLNKNIKGNRSKAEIMLSTALKASFPLWTVLENDRSILDGLELDIYIPEVRLAIEWNGIFHYEPIRGQKGLELIVGKDNLKIEKCRLLGIELIVICDLTSHLSFIKETVASLIDKLKPLYQNHPASESN